MTELSVKIQNEHTHKDSKVLHKIASRTPHQYKNNDIFLSIRYTALFYEENAWQAAKEKTKTMHQT